MAVHDLRFGLDLELAQLVAQPGNRRLQFHDMEVEGADLLVEARMVDADLAGRVEQVLEQVGVDAREFLALVRRT